MNFGHRFDTQTLSSLQAEEELREACARRALQLEEMGRRERLLRADVGQAKEQVGGRRGWEQPAAGAVGSKSAAFPPGKDVVPERRRGRAES